MKSKFKLNRVATISLFVLLITIFIAACGGGPAEAMPTVDVAPTPIIVQPTPTPGSRITSVTTPFQEGDVWQIRIEGVGLGDNDEDFWPILYKDEGAELVANRIDHRDEYIIAMLPEETIYGAYTVVLDGRNTNLIASEPLIVEAKCPATSSPTGRFKVEYFPNLGLTGEPYLVCLFAGESLNLELLGEDFGLWTLKENFSLRITAQLELTEAGKYKFSGVVDDNLELQIDGAPQYNCSQREDGVWQFTCEEKLSTGSHVLVAEVKQKGGNAQFAIAWEYLGPTPIIREISPSEVLYGEERIVEIRGEHMDAGTSVVDFILNGLAVAGRIPLEITSEKVVIYSVPNLMPRTYMVFIRGVDGIISNGMEFTVLPANGQGTNPTPQPVIQVTTTVLPYTIAGLTAHDLVGSTFLSWYMTGGQLPPNSVFRTSCVNETDSFIKDGTDDPSNFGIDAVWGKHLAPWPGFTGGNYSCTVSLIDGVTTFASATVRAYLYSNPQLNPPPDPNATDTPEPPNDPQPTPIP